MQRLTSTASLQLGIGKGYGGPFGARCVQACRQIGLAIVLPRKPWLKQKLPVVGR